MSGAPESPAILFIRGKAQAAREEAERLERLAEEMGAALRNGDGEIMRVVAVPRRSPRKVQPKPASSAAGSSRGDAVIPRLRRALVSMGHEPFTLRVLAEKIGASNPNNIRSSVALMVNMGELAIAHEGTSKHDPTTWRVAKLRGGDA